MTAPPLSIDPASGVPPYEQVRQQVADLARSGAWAPETRLPTVRALADQLGIAANTVARAYKELEAAGVVETRGRHGTFVAASADAVAREAHSAATAYVARVRELGLGREEAVTLVVRVLDQP